MVRYVACTAVVLFAGATLRAGELDNEFGAKVPAAPAKTITLNGGAGAVAVLAPAGAADSRMASELDTEMPAQSWRRCGWGGCGWGGCGWHGCGWRACGWGWGGCGWRGCGWGGCGWRRCGFVSLPFYSPCFFVGYGGYPVWGSCW
jgi:hypothetical protein